MRYLLFLLIPLLSFGQIQSNQVAYALGENPAGSAFGSVNFGVFKRHVYNSSSSPSVPSITLTTKYAFPGAFGAGRVNTGGRGGSYYAVTNLNNSGAGSFRDGLSSGSRVLIIQKEGLVPLTSDLDITAKNDITIWGQFAPGRGITVSNKRTFVRNSENWIMRFVTFQNKDLTEPIGNGGDDAFYWGQNETGYTHSNTNGLYADHISARYGNDQVFSVESRFAVDRNTIAYSLFAEGGEGHNVGGVSGNQSTAGQAVGDMTYARNMWHNLSHRFPNHTGGYGLTNGGDFEQYNQLFSNWTQRFAAVNGPVKIDFFKNYASFGNTAKAAAPVNKLDYVSTQWSAAQPLIYSNNNYVEGWDETPNADQKSVWYWRKTRTGVSIEGDDVIVNTQVDAPSLYTSSRQHNFPDPVDGIWDVLDVPDKVMASVGHNRGINSDGTPGFFRDDKDAGYITKVTNGSEESTYRTRSTWDNTSFTGEIMYAETDGDFMPDYFEDANFDQPTGAEVGLNSASAADRDQVIVNWDFGDYTVVNNAGYTNLEMCAAYYAGDFETILDGTNDLNITIE